MYHDYIHGGVTASVENSLASFALISEAG